MTDIFINAQSYPFSIALSVVFGLFLLEILSLLVGGSIMALGADIPDVDIDVDLDADFDIEVDLNTDALADIADAPSGMMGWTGLQDVPFMIWLVSFLTVFGLSGLILQLVTSSIFGAALPASLASLAALPVGLFGARFFARIVATMMPKHESQAMRKRFLGGHYGTITQGIARRGKPAEAKIKDRYGNFHYLRVEPLDDKDVIPQGASVHVMRKKDGTFFVVDIT